MFGIKTKIKKKISNSLNKKKFNQKGISLFELFFLKKIILQQLENEASFNNIQTPVSNKTNYIVKKTMKNMYQFMPNNLGNWSISKPHSLTTNLENNLIRALKNSYSCSTDIIGHFGSGSTEGNIFASWIGRNYLQKKLFIKDTKSIIMLKSSLAHYSIDKAADIVGVKIEESNIKIETMNLSEQQLLKQINKLYKKGIKGFLIPLTLGYTVSGTEDNYILIHKLIQAFQKSHSDAKFFIWLDTAFSGISNIYTKNNFRPFENKDIQLITSDFHKILSVPYPSSFMLYRSSLVNLISKEIPYIDQLDTTLLGSRPGINILATCITLFCLGKTTIQKHIQDSLQRKNIFLTKIEQESKNIRIVSDQKSVQACLITDNFKITTYLNKKYNLNAINYELKINNKKKKLFIHKLYFFPRII